MSHFRPTSRGEDLGEHLDVFRALPCFGGSLRQMSSVYVTSCFPWDDVIRFFLPHVKIQVGRSLSKSLNSLQKILLQWATSGQLQGERTWESTWMSSGGKLSWRGVLQVSQVRRQMVGTCGKRFMWLKMKGGATYLAETANRVVQPTRIADFKFCIIKGRFMT